MSGDEFPVQLELEEMEAVSLLLATDPLLQADELKSSGQGHTLTRIHGKLLEIPAVGDKYPPGRNGDGDEPGQASLTEGSR